MPRRDSRPERINNVARKYAKHSEKLRFAGVSGYGQKKPLQRKESKPRVKRLIAYDLETTRIKEGSPEPRYITAYGEAREGKADESNFFVSCAVDSISNLGRLIISRFLDPDLSGTRYVAWNGNHFDVFLIGAALLHSDKYILRPYLTRGKSLRGLRVTQKVKKGEKALSWEFLDGISMTLGNVPCTLKKFLSIFAPEFGKLDGPDFEREEFDATNPKHVEYAERDSIGLYHAMMKVQAIVFEHFGVPLHPTIGNTGIRIFQRNMPEGVLVWEPPYTVLNLIRDTVMRGGYCWRQKKYCGPIWKYDINQAYAAAMRETRLPSGRCIRSPSSVNKFAKVFIVRIEAEKRGNKIPFYYRDVEGDGVFGLENITDTWITSIEYHQLKVEGWKMNVKESYFWDETFTMKEYVDRLEKLRVNSPGGPNGAQGMVIKAIGNNSYGKTVETLDGIELLLSQSQPEGFYEYQAESDELQHVWFRLNRPVPREYHQPQIGAFITAHVRMVVRRAALLAPDHWIYADTDCVVFSKPVKLDISPSTYGMWKEEVKGDVYRFIQKKVYAKVGGGDLHAKGMNVKRLTDDDMERWFNGESPKQSQLQRNNFLKVMTGAPMFVTRVKVGEVFPPKIAA